jgi:hypothetical protein
MLQYFKYGVQICSGFMNLDYPDRIVPPRATHTLAGVACHVPPALALSESALHEEAGCLDCSHSNRCPSHSYWVPQPGPYLPVAGDMLQGGELLCGTAECITIQIHGRHHSPSARYLPV